MTSRVTFKQLLKEAIKKTVAKNSLDKWIGSENYHIKCMPTTNKGTLGEVLTTDILCQLGFDAERINEGKGDFDVIVRKNKLFKSTVYLEVKLATEDVGFYYQFNSIDKGKDYTHVFCIGVGPNEIKFGIWTWKEIQSLTTNMSKAGGGFKLRVPGWRLNLLTYENVHNAMNGVTMHG